MFICNTETTKSKNRQAGFTLVELAIVMIIIGLLIAGILKGQEMIVNAQINKTITQIQSIDAAAASFRDIYNAFPGDMINASARLRNCNAGNCNDGNGNGRLDNPPNMPPGVLNEGTFFFTQMAAADLISGVDGRTLYTGSSYPEAAINGGFTAGYVAINTFLFPAGELKRRHYLALNDGNTAGFPAGAVISAQAARIDRKLDDGAPLSGSVISQSTCRVADAGGNIVYNEADQNSLCVMMFQLSN